MVLRLIIYTRIYEIEHTNINDIEYCIYQIAIVGLLETVNIQVAMNHPHGGQ